MPDRLSLHAPILVNTIGHCAGAIAFGILLYLLLLNWRRATAERSLLPSIAAALAFFWNVGSLIGMATAPAGDPVVDTIIAGSFSSLKFEGRAPAGFILARVFLGGVLQSDMMQLSDDDMIAAAREEFRALVGVTAAPGITEVQRWPAAMPQYAVGHLDRVAQIEAAAAPIPNLFLAGAAYRGVGVPDCVHSGEIAAEAAFERLAARN